jgi:hypothetical protein
MDVRGLLETELKYAFGNAVDLVKHMEVSVLYKGVTYELLTAPDFIAVAVNKLPMFKNLWEHHRAAPESKDGQMELLSL